MLKLIGITKEYVIGTTKIPAINSIDLEFRESEFVSILGPSGCGKTTLLNIIGGLDKYTTGDLLIDGKSTKQFKDVDWDAYRNSTIGFVFQNYNLISHLSVFENIAISLTLSGVSAKERKERVLNVLEEVGLADQTNKRPNQLSGGQMQRVAIARALVNNPKVLLADEPTGALDSVTSVQIMELIKKISKDRLVIMVTHNSQIAQQFSDRIIKLSDGKVVEDSNLMENKKPLLSEEKLINKKTSMSYLTALKSSFKNLLSKKARTIITSIAGSIGIIGIALVLAISSGMTSYVNTMQGDTLAGFPITIDETFVSMDMSGPPGMRQEDSSNEFPDSGKIFSYNKNENMNIHYNLISQDYLDYIGNMDTKLYNSIALIRKINLNVIAKTGNDSYKKVNTKSSGNFMSTSKFIEMPNNKAFIESQYDILQGRYPENYNEIVVIVDKKNRLTIELLAEFGISIKEEYTFDEFIGKEFKVIGNNEFYEPQGEVFVPNSDLQSLYNNANATTIKIVGVMRVKESAATELLNPSIGYTVMLTDKMLEDAIVSDIVLAQKDSTDISVITGNEFNEVNTYISTMRALGGDTMPTGIQIYPVSFDAKDEIKAYLDKYNAGKENEAQILYSDLAELITGIMATLIKSITLILTAFAAISLVVSSIMIGIITYVSVVERTKEIGILRSMGARKKDISRVFNAETLIIGFIAGLIGVLMTLLLTIPINMLIYKQISVANFSKLPVQYGLMLVAISMALTFIAGLIPSRIAAKKDPVVALRTE